VYLEPIHEYVVGQTRPALILLGVATAFLLVVACANVAALLLARTAQRSRELSLRVALGASPGRVRRQLFTEGLALAVAGGAVGLFAVALLQPLLRLTLPASYPRIDEMSVDLTTVLWAVALALAAAIAAGIAPSWRRAHTDPHASLKQGGGPATAGPLATLWRRGLVAIQVALVVLLMLGGGLLARTLWNLQTVDLGFNASNLLTMEMRMLDPKYRNVPTLRLFEQNVLSGVRALPGVERASISSAVPLRGIDTLMALTTASGRHRVNRRAIDADFFETLRIPLRAGRQFERVESGNVVILSESAAALLFPGGNALGETLEIQRSFTPIKALVIGIVSDVRYLRVEEPGHPAIYVPREQLPVSTICLVVRGSGNVDGLAESVREVIRAIDPGQPVEGVTTIGQIVAASIADRRFYAVATVGFSLVGLFLAIAGLYGVVSQTVAERVRELGVRIVLGASRKDVVRLVLRQGLLPVAAGLGIGGVAAFWTTGLLRRFLFGVAAIDPAIYAAVPVLVVVVAAVACWIPARRASDVNPIEALRAE
jgi:putative ABC transport system permease protein